MSKTQKRTPVASRRCSACVSTSRDCVGNDENNLLLVPEDIEVEIQTNASSVLQKQTQFGRSVHLDAGSEYVIKVNNNTSSKRLAVVIRVDGRDVSPAPILIGKSRVIDGFTLSRAVTEQHESGKGNTYLINKKVARFRVASKHASQRRGNTNDKIGTIECEFYRVKMQTIQPGNRTRKLRKAGQRASLGLAPSGLMATNQGETYTQAGTHGGSGNKKPVADYSRPLGAYKLFICHRTVPSFAIGDFLQ